MTRRSVTTVTGSVLALLMGVPFWVTTDPAQAAVATYSLDYIFSPATGSVGPLGTVTITDLGTAVRFDVQNQAGAGTKLDSVYFNFAQGAINPTVLTFANVSVSASMYTTLLAPTISATVSALKADGDGYFDGKIALSGSNYLGHNQTLSFELSAAGHNLGIEDFHVFSLPGGGSGSYIMASHIQNLPSAGGSVWVGSVAAVPLPGAFILFGAGLAGILLAKVRNVLP